MQIQNGQAYDIQIEDLPPVLTPNSSLKLPGGLILAAGATYTIWNADAARSAILLSLLTAGTITKLSDAEANDGTVVGLAMSSITGTTNANAGSRSNHAHSLGYTPAQVLIVPIAPADDDANAAAVDFVTADATNIVVKSSAESVPFKAYFV